MGINEPIELGRLNRKIHPKMYALLMWMKGLVKGHCIRGLQPSQIQKS